MELTVYHLKNCDTCKKAIKALEAYGYQLTLNDVRADGVSPEALAQLEAAVGFEALVNSRSTTWRRLGEANRQNMTRQKATALMSTYPTLIKRPVIVNCKSVTVGWTRQVQAVYIDLKSSP